MTNAKPKIYQYRDKTTLFSETAARCHQQLKSALDRNNQASFIIPGGTTPGPVFEQLSKSELDWRNVYIAQSDERWVDADHPSSNQGLTEKTLLINQAKNARYVPMKNQSITAEAGAQQCCIDYHTMPTPFSLTMLGMGLDGHIASLFPKADIIQNALNASEQQVCMAVDATGCEVAGDFPERMSLTYAGILNSELILLLMIGQSKIDVVEQAMSNTDPLAYPISQILNQTNVPVEIHWCE